MPHLFLDIDGVLVIPIGGSLRGETLSKDVLDTGQFSKPMVLAAYAKPFLKWASKHFNLYWLTGHPRESAEALSVQVFERTDVVRWVDWRGIKSDAIQKMIRKGEIAKDDWWWIEDSLLDCEAKWLSLSGHLGRFLFCQHTEGMQHWHAEFLRRELGLPVEQGMKE